MKSVADWLRDGDPLAAERDLPDEDAQRMRQRVLAHHVDERDATGALWRGVAVLTSIVIATFALGTWLTNARAGGSPGPDVRLDVATSHEQPPPRQVQFLTPRGTRVVWVLHAQTSQEGVR